MSVIANNITVTDEEFDNKVVILKKHLRSRMNGKTSEQMQNGMIDYTLNYGVSLEHVKELADILKYSADDCRKIWRLNIREAMLIAAMTMPSAEATCDEMLEWASIIRTPDMAEQASFFLFWRTTDISKFISCLVAAETSYSLSIASFTAGRALQKNIAIDEDSVIAVIDRCRNSAKLRSHEGRGISLMLRQAVRKQIVAPQIEDLISGFKNSDDDIRRQIAFEVEAEKEM